MATDVFNIGETLDIQVTRGYWYYIITNLNLIVFTSLIVFLLIIYIILSRRINNGRKEISQSNADSVGSILHRIHIDG